jgi:hypothetical protein
MENNLNARTDAPARKFWPLVGCVCTSVLVGAFLADPSRGADRPRRKDTQTSTGGAAQPGRNSRKVNAAEPAAATDAPQSTPDSGEKVHPLAPALKIARESREALNGVRDYTALFFKEELVGRRMVRQAMELKLREKPFSVYLRFQDPHRGREVIYVDGQNRGNLLVHEEGVKGLVGTVQLLPTSPQAMDENRYPVTRLGLTNLLNTIIEQWEAESKFGESDVQYFPEAKVGQTACQVIEASHPQPRRQFKFHKTRLYLDKQTKLPIRVEQFSWPARAGDQAPLVEMYMYSNLKTNASLSERDFDPRNPSYRF